MMFLYMTLALLFGWGIIFLSKKVAVFGQFKRDVLAFNLFLNLILMIYLLIQGHIWAVVLFLNYKVIQNIAKG